MMANPLIFYSMAKLNQIAVEAFLSFVGTVPNFNNIPTSGVDGLIRILMTFVNVGLVIKINIDYFTRAVMITVLHIIIPMYKAEEMILEGTEILFSDNSARITQINAMD